MKVDFPLELTCTRVPFGRVAQVSILSKLAIVVCSPAGDHMINEREIQSPLQTFRAVDLEGVHEFLFKRGKAIVERHLVCVSFARVNWMQFLLKAFPVFVLRIERSIFGVFGIVRP